MSTYICKCGKTFQKNTGAGTTGFRMPDYGPNHECYGCPFVQEEQWREGGENIAVYACRGSKVLDYQTDAYCCDSKGSVLHIRTLDLEFIQIFFKDYLTLPGHTYEYLYHGTDSPENGKWQYSFGFAANKQGDADRKTIIDRYFRSEGERPGVLPSGCECLVRKDVTPEQEKEIVLNQIKEAKAVAQGKNAPAKVGQKYYHFGIVYFAGQRADNARYTVFLDDADHPGPDTLTEVATVPDFDTLAEAQSALDDMAAKQGFTTECPAGAIACPEGAEEMNELAGQADLAPDAASVDREDNVPEFGNGEAESAGDVDETPDSDNDSGNSENDPPEEQQEPCDWKNASGGDEKDEDNPEDEPEEVSGDPLSLRGHEFDQIVSTADNVLNKLVAILHAKKQHDGEMTVKVTFEDDGYGQFIFGGSVSGKINYSVKPQKISSEPLELQFDAQGNPIVPTDREHQLNFDEIQPGQREYPPQGGTATVDGKTGIVESYQADGQEPEDPPTSDDITNPVVADDMEDSELPADGAAPGETEPEKLYPCKNTGCLFYVYDTDGPDASGCGFAPTEDADDSFDIAEAVEQNGCTRPEVLQIYADADPEEDTNYESEAAK